MKVYVLTQRYPYEGETVYGVYFTHSDAVAAARENNPKLLIPGSYDDWMVHEFVVGAAAAWNRDDWDNVIKEDGA